MMRSGFLVSFFALLKVAMPNTVAQVEHKLRSICYNLLVRKKIAMNEYHFLTLAEKLLELYNTKSIAIDPDIRYSDEFRSLVGEIQDAVSCVE